MNWKNDFNSDLINQGEKLFLANKITSFNKFNALITAKVEDGQRNYNVQIDSSDLDNLKYACDCRDFRINKSCSHIVATLAFYENKQNNVISKADVTKQENELVFYLDKIEKLKMESVNNYLNDSSNTMMIRTVVKCKNLVANDLMTLLDQKKYDISLKLAYKILQTFYFDTLVFKSLILGIEDVFTIFLQKLMENDNSRDLLVKYLLKIYLKIHNQTIKEFVNKIILDTKLLTDFPELFQIITRIFNHHYRDINDGYFAIALLNKYSYSNKIIFKMIKKAKFTVDVELVKVLLLYKVSKEIELETINQILELNLYFYQEAIDYLTHKKAQVYYQLNMKNLSLQEYEKLFFDDLDDTIVEEFIQSFPDKSLNFIANSYRERNPIDDNLINMFLKYEAKDQLFNFVLSTNKIEDILMYHDLLAEIDEKKLLDYYLQFLSKAIYEHENSYFKNLVKRIYNYISLLDHNGRYQRIIKRNWTSMQHRALGLVTIIEENKNQNS